ncbi:MULTISPECIES: SMP-30/gluconolactonase/LRE family protein [Streptomyces]|uniref:hypothetical protein n=1 Tax=Streptomyces TaxID=1883 RepID=UPI00163BE1BD|nr:MULTISPECIES: hypothetical protein [Streptomyces]MBC2877128.1 hypothetical protein [Streptomyces sp. TYQ1024]UBI39401.1 hypothetical protein K7I03_24995 [Streptomyces mobaraensis]UKW31981.1 hypothetical protein MCU78_24930 [Streptomyces sp. TYQ1024]
MRNTALRPHATLPGPYDAGTVLATTVDARGNALWLLCPDAETVRNPYGPSYPKPRRYPYDALLVSSDGTPPVDRTLTGVRVRPSALDVLPDGRVLLVGGGAGESNAQLLGRDGRPPHRFSIGRGARFVRADRQGTLWSAYSDEGVYGDPLAAAGLVRWDGHGNRQWSLTPPDGLPHPVDAHALNVDDDGGAWFAYHPSPRLLHVRADGRVASWTTPVARPRGIAAHGAEVALLADGLLHRCRASAGTLDPLEETRLTLPDGTPLTRYTDVVGRGRRLYVRGKSVRQWYVLDIDM